MREIASSVSPPRIAVWIATIAVLPILLLALQVAARWPLSPRLTGPALYNLTIYASVLLAFLGGVHWGLALARSRGSDALDLRAYVVALLPALAGWAGLWLAARNGLLVLATAYVAALVYDLWVVRRGEAPRWYGRLRVAMTVAVAAALLAAAFLGPFA